MLNDSEKKGEREYDKRKGKMRCGRKRCTLDSAY